MSGSRNRKSPYPESPSISRQRVRVIWDPDNAAADGQVLVPTMDVFEKEDDLVIEIELPGVRKEDIEVYVERDAVCVEGTKQDLKIRDSGPGKRVSYLQLERKLGRFRREIKLPIVCDTTKVRASYKDGLLTVELARIKDRRGQKRRIEVK